MSETNTNQNDFATSITSHDSHEHTSVMKECGMEMEEGDGEVSEEVSYNDSDVEMKGRRKIGKLTGERKQQIFIEREKERKNKSRVIVEGEVVEEGEVVILDDNISNSDTHSSSSSSSDRTSSSSTSSSSTSSSSTSSSSTNSRSTNSSSTSSYGTSTRGGKRGGRGKGGKGGRGGRDGRGGGKGGSDDRIFLCHWKVRNEDREKYGAMVMDLVKVGEWYLRSALAWGSITKEEDDMRRVVEEWERAYGWIRDSEGRLGRGRYREGHEVLVEKLAQDDKDRVRREEEMNELRRKVSESDGSEEKKEVAAAREETKEMFRMMMKMIGEKSGVSAGEVREELAVERGRREKVEEELRAVKRELEELRKEKDERQQSKREKRKRRKGKSKEEKEEKKGKVSKTVCGGGSKGGKRRKCTVVKRSSSSVGTVSSVGSVGTANGSAVRSVSSVSSTSSSSSSSDASIRSAGESENVGVTLGEGGRRVEYSYSAASGILSRAFEG